MRLTSSRKRSRRVASHAESSQTRVRDVAVHRWHDTSAGQTILVVLVPDESNLSTLQRDAINAATNLIEKALS